MMTRLIRALNRREVPPPEGLPEGVSLRAGRLIPAVGGLLSGMGKPAAAVTLGRTIIVHPGARCTGPLIRHELAHVKQWQRHPFTFPLRYVWNHARFGYHDNPFEVEARAAERASAPDLDAVTPARSGE